MHFPFVIVPLHVRLEVLKLKDTELADYVLQTTENIGKKARERQIFQQIKLYPETENINLPIASQIADR